MSESIVLLFSCPVNRKVPLAISLSLLSLLIFPESRILSHCPKVEKKCLLRSAQRFTIYSKVKSNFVTSDF